LADVDPQSSAARPKGGAVSDEFGTAHELPVVFEAHGHPLNATLVEMLNEHFSHRTERRGCGYTQATRHLAALVNRAEPDRKGTRERLFPSELRPEGAEEPIERVLPALLGTLEREESKLLGALIADLVVAAGAAAGIQELVVSVDEPKVGTCPLAEKYFLEISDRFVRRKGRVNVLLSDAGEPVLVEKLNLGDNYSCINVAELMLNGVRLPPGCLIGVKYDGELQGRANRKLPGRVVQLSQCTGFKFLRFTTLAVSPRNRARAFTSHFRAQIDAGLFAPGEATIAQLRRVAEEQL